MTIFPKSHKQFIAWASKIASNLDKDTKGKYRIGHNKLAAAMAKSLPGVSNAFNINTLKAALDNDKSLPEQVNNKITTNSESSAIFNCLKIDISHTVYEWMEQTVGLLIQGERASLFDSLNRDGAITDFYDDFHNITEETFIIANAYFSEKETELLDDTYAEWPTTSVPFNVIQRKTVGYAYRTYLLDAICLFFRELANQYETLVDVRKLNKEQLAKWVGDSFELWSEKEGVYIPKNAPCFSLALEKLLGPIQYKYTVVVRAIISGDYDFINDWSMPIDWQGYDFVRGDDDSDSVLRADCIVNVVASTDDEAIELAKSSAPDLLPPDELTEVKLWVDSEQSSDIERGASLPRS